MKIALIAKKGGVGKTTLCVLLHEAFRQTGQTVAIRDYDSQGTASKALKIMGGQKEVAGQSYQQLLIDSPPSLTLAATAAAVTVADVVLVPSSPSPADLWEAEEAAQFARERNARAVVRIVMNRTRAGTLLTQGLEQSAAGLSAPVLTARLAERQSYQHVLMGGWEMLDAKACQEVIELTQEVISLGRVRDKLITKKN